MDQNENSLESEENTFEQQPEEATPADAEPAPEQPAPAEEPVQEPAPTEEPAQELTEQPEAPAQETAPQPQPYNTVAAEQEALRSTGSSVFMLIACIVTTLSLCSTFLGNILSLNFFDFTPLILDALIVAGLWVTFALCKKNKLPQKGLMLIKIPYIILFVLTVISFAFGFLGTVMSFAISFNPVNVFILLLTIVAFVFKAICFKSVKRILTMSQKIADGQSTMGTKAGKMAAIAMIIAAAITFIIAVIPTSESGMSTLEMLADLPFIGDIFQTILEGLGGALQALAFAGYVFGILSAVVVLLADISVAILLLRYVGQIKKAREAGNAAYNG